MAAVGMSNSIVLTLLYPRKMIKEVRGARSNTSIMVDSNCINRQLNRPWLETFGWVEVEIA